MPDHSSGVPDQEAMETLAAEHSRSSRPSRDWGSEDDPATVHLLEPYTDMGQVARGGMGLVRRAWDPDLRRHVAVKVIRPSLADDRDTELRFTEEARITGQLDHPNVVPVHRLGRSDDGTACLVMKLVEGRTFTDYLRGLPPAPWPPAVLDEALGVFLKVCDAVAFAHSRGVVHRDLKPDNVMVGSFGQVYVMDWGIARVLHRGDHAAEEDRADSPMATAPMGTPAYMTPEQALRNEAAIDERTDVYLLGAMLYQVLTGRTPHEGQTLVAVLYHAVNGEIVPPDRAAPERQVPLALARIAMKALQKQREDRYQSVPELRRDVESFLRGDERAPTRTFRAGERILVQGEEGAAAFVIVTGRCLAYKEQDGDRIPLREMGPGEVFGETSVFTARPVSATVEAVEPTTVKVVTRESLTESLGLHTWMGAFVQTLAERFREVDERLRTLEHRLASGDEPGG